MIATLVTLLAMEAAVRLVAPQQLIEGRPDLWRPLDSLGWAHRPNVSTTMNTGERTVGVFTDRDGFRVGREGRVERPVRVLLLGDSFMAALQVEDSQTTARRLERDIARASGLSVEVRNSGVAGWDPNQYLVQARRAIAQERYRLAIVSIFVGNDAIESRQDHLQPLSEAPAPGFQLPQSFTWGAIIDAVLRPLNDELEGRSHLFVLLKTRAAVLRMRLGITAEYFPPEYKRSAEGLPAWQVTASVAKEIETVARGGGMQTLFVFIPYHFQIDTAAFHRYVRGFGIDTADVDIDLPNRRLAEEFARQGLCVVDVLRPFRAAAASGQLLYGRVDTHLTPDGHAIVSRLVAPLASAMLMQPDARCPADSSQRL